MRPQTKFIALLLFTACTVLLQGCFPLAATGIGAAVVMVDDRRSTGIYVEDENIEWKARARLLDRFRDAHVNVTSFNLSVLVTGEVPGERHDQGSGSRDRQAERQGLAVEAARSCLARDPATGTNW